MQTDAVIEYLPTDNELSASKNWKAIIVLNVVAIALWAFFNHGIKDQGVNGWIFLAGMLLLCNVGIILFSKQAIKLTLNKTTGALQYDYVDFFLREKSTTVYLKTACFEYKAYVTKGSAPMRILTYNNYFKNQIELKAMQKNGFTREQLDEIADNVREIMEKLKVSAVSFVAYRCRKRPADRWPSSTLSIRPQARRLR